MGNQLKKEINKNGKKISQIAYELGVSRATIYNKFKQKKLNEAFLIKIKKIIPINLKEFGVFTSKSTQKKFLSHKFRNSTIYKKIENHILLGDEVDIFDDKMIRLQKNYLNVLEKYNDLLLFLGKIFSKCKDQNIRNKIKEFIKNLEI